MSDFEFKVEGLKELEQEFSKFDKKVKRKYAHKALRKGGNVILKSARSKVRSVSGNLAKSLAVVTGKGLQIFITPTKRRRKKGNIDGWYAHFVELGTKPHIIKKKGKGVLAVAGKVLGKKVKHPGTKAKPFLRPALDEKGKEAVNVARDELYKLIEKDF